ncbi:Hypothetical Protein FCC1311_089742 [Hondaea fermentalgiana]|uniref:Immune mapped protein 2 N-terminal domain-containing protein n=1 Tax=Hondaea fermentalgiana TaxID=2315210 RepID=A0A2R5GR11_9STRA|nr:Hypothetical Protein FCC1311_089742 [Hondaea fermentalgiana]|eukprot:GBG32749.1 Hypothetical Protein FCC1311_089742 [Hondaea fermentalgiana]
MGIFTRGGSAPRPPRKPSKYKGYNYEAEDHDDDEGLPEWFDENDGAPPNSSSFRERQVPARAATSGPGYSWETGGGGGGGGGSYYDDVDASAGADDFDDDDGDDGYSAPPPTRTQRGGGGGGGGGGGYSWETSGASSSGGGSGGGGGGGGGYSWETSAPTRAPTSAPGGYSWETSAPARQDPTPASNEGSSTGYSWEQSGRTGGGIVRAPETAKPSAAPAAWALARRSKNRGGAGAGAGASASAAAGGSRTGGDGWRNHGNGWRHGEKPKADAHWRQEAASEDDDDNHDEDVPATTGGYSWETNGTGGGASASAGGYSWETSGTDAADRGGYSWEEPAKRRSSRGAALLKRLSGRLSGSRGAMVASPGSGSDMESYAQGAGCYLIFETNSNGVLYAQWSSDGSAPANAWAYFRPQKKVPAYKYTQNKGRMDILKISGDKKKIYDGVAQFIKDAVTYRATFVPLDHSEIKFDMYGLTYELTVFPFNLGQEYSTNRLEAVAVVPHSSLAYEGITKTSRGYFLSTGNKAGVSSAM